jgi:hypothetical protein
MKITTFFLFFLKTAKSLVFLLGQSTSHIENRAFFRSDKFVNTLPLLHKGKF